VDVREGIIGQHLGTLAQINEASMCKNLIFGDLRLQAGLGGAFEDFTESIFPPTAGEAR